MKKYILMLIGMIVFILSDVIAEEKKYDCFQRGSEYVRDFETYPTFAIIENVEFIEAGKAVEKYMNNKNNYYKYDEKNCKKISENTIECDNTYTKCLSIKECKEIKVDGNEFLLHYCFPTDVGISESELEKKHEIERNFINNVDSSNNKKANNLFPFD